MAAWLPQPVMFDSSHSFDCEGFNVDQCRYYKERWHNWYVADWTFALPTVAFFMCTIGIFIIGNILGRLFFWSRRPEPLIWQRCVAATRYLSYRGFHVKKLRWYSAPIGVLVLGAIGTIYFFWSDMVWGNSPPLGTRSGWLALACMPFLFATASKTNWITLLTGVTHEKLQVFHRWIAYAFFILALMHTFPFVVWHIRNHDMVDQFTISNIFEYWTGVVALLFQAWLTFMSCGPIRNLGYEFFKAAHFLAAVAFMLIFFWHCDGTLTSWHYFVATGAIYVPCWIYPWLRTLFEYGTGQKAHIFMEENGFIRVTIPVKFGWQPGQHCFLRFRHFGIFPTLSSHPFTICSLPSNSTKRPSEITFYIRHRAGFTANLYNHALNRPGVPVPVLVDGPYGGIDNYKYFSSDRLIVVGGGSGAGWMLPLVEQFLRHRSFKNGRHDSSTEKPGEKEASDELTSKQSLHEPQFLRVILATRDIATRTWFHTTINDLLSEHKLPSISPDLSVEVHLTGEAERIVQPPTKSALDTETSRSLSSEDVAVKNEAGEHQHIKTHNVPEEEVRGRPALPSIIEEEAAAASATKQTVGVFVCGPLTMQSDIRNAVAKENLRIFKSARSGRMYLHLEHFSWA